MLNYKKYFTFIGHLDINSEEGFDYLPLFLKERMVDFDKIMSAKSEMQAKLFDEKKELILSVPLFLSHYCGDSSETSLAAVRGYIPFDERTQEIQFEYNEKIISKLQTPKDRPQLKIITKPPSHIDCENIDLEWEVLYKGDPSLLEFKLLYTNNGGKTWQRIGDRTKELKILIDVSTLVGGNSCRFLVQVTDGYNNAQSEIRGFSVENKSNEVMIMSPIAGDVLSSGRSIFFNGQCYNPNTDEEITEGFDWTSSIDGELGKGSMLQTLLTKGEHTIQLNVSGILDSVCLHIE